MKSFKTAVFYGFVVWAIPFAVAFLIFSLKETNRPLFESIMPVAVVFSVVVFAKLYFKKVDKNYLQEGISLGLVWLVINLAIDLLMFMQGPMKMSFLDYISDIGVTYLIIPTVTVGFGGLLEKKS